MDYEWDENKSDWNRRNRGFSFGIMRDFDWDFALLADVQTVDYEERELWIGPIGTQLYAVVLIWRGDNVRIISLRRAEQTDITKWRKEFQND